MDAKTVIEILRKHDTLENQNKDSDFEVYYSVSHQQANEIADFIEQQESTIAGLMQTIESQKETNLAIVRKYQEQEDSKDDFHPVDVEEIRKYAELGRLAMEAISKYKGYSSKVCTDVSNFDDGCTPKRCEWSEFCQKRAELLAGEPND